MTWQKWVPPGTCITDPHAPEDFVAFRVETR